MKEEIIAKIKEWREWCDNDEDTMNDHIRDLFFETLDRGELFEILEMVEKYER